jgi:hypothetical protein
MKSIVKTVIELARADSTKTFRELDRLEGVSPEKSLLDAVEPSSSA